MLHHQKDPFTDTLLRGHKGKKAQHPGFEPTISCLLGMFLTTVKQVMPHY